ncbi:MAG: LysM peptidoglycan-binding domain-containing protein [candidate division WOR-3 bacterium]|nr:LysM peptidoglycan-binding domain-containing protein [candidate division WOR-3 bacterium]
MKRYLLIVVLSLFVVFALTAQAQEEGKLKPEEAEEQIQKYTAQEEALKAQLQTLEDEINALKAYNKSLDEKIEELEQEKANLMKKMEEMSYYTVKPGDWLSKLAEYPRVYGHGNYSRWPEIYKANTDKIKDPDLILPGWKLSIPRP